MAELSEDDCLAISRSPLEPTIGHLRRFLHRAIEIDDADSQKTQTFSDDEETSDSTEADDEPGWYPYARTHFAH